MTRGRSAGTVMSDGPSAGRLVERLGPGERRQCPAIQIADGAGPLTGGAYRQAVLVPHGVSQLLVAHEHLVEPLVDNDVDLDLDGGADADAGGAAGGAERGVGVTFGEWRGRRDHDA